MGITMKDVREEGVYANGFLTVQPMPLEVHGPQARKSLPIRRIEKVLEDNDMEDHVFKELQKVRHERPGRWQTAEGLHIWYPSFQDYCVEHTLERLKSFYFY